MRSKRLFALPPLQHLPHRGGYIHCRVIQQHGIRRWLQGRDAAIAVARITRLQVGAQVVDISRKSLRNQLLIASLRPLFGVGRQKHLQGCLGKHHCSHVAPVGHQPRRGNIRFKRKDGKKPEFIHALNASGLATSRLLPAIVEQFQQADGSVIVPDVLRKWVGKDVLPPR